MARFRNTVFCDFCHKNQHEVKLLIAGPQDSAICDECVTIAVQIVNENKDKPKDSDVDVNTTS